MKLVADYEVTYRPVINKDWVRTETLLLKSDAEPKTFRRTPMIGTKNETVTIPAHRIISMVRV